MISFVIPAHDEQQHVAATLDAVHAAARALRLPYEVIVVDDASSDQTAAIASSHGARVVRVDYRHIAATRNAGARAARGARLVFVDADTLVDATVLSAALAALDAGAVGGGAAVRLLGRSSWMRRVAVAAIMIGFRSTGIAPGCFVFCTRTAFEAVGGFDERYFAGEDVAISRALARHGRFVVLRQATWTSARKLHTFGLADHLRLLWRFARHGRASLMSRQHLQLWYARRRHDTRRD